MPSDNEKLSSSSSSLGNDRSESSDMINDQHMKSMNEEMLQEYMQESRLDHMDMESARASFSITDASIRSLLIDDSDMDNYDSRRNSLTLDMIYNTPEIMGITGGSSSDDKIDGDGRQSSIRSIQLGGESDAENENSMSLSWLSPASQALGSSLSRISSPLSQRKGGIDPLPFGDETDARFVDAQLPLHEIPQQVGAEWEGETARGHDDARLDNEEFMSFNHIDFENAFDAGASTQNSSAFIDDKRQKSIRFAEVVSQPIEDQDGNDDDKSEISLSTYDVFHDRRYSADGGSSKDQSASTTEATDDDTSDVGSDDHSESSEDPEKEKEKELKRGMLYAAFGAGLFAFVGWGFKKLFNNNNDTVEAAMNVGQEGAGHATEAALSNAVDVADAAREIADVAQAVQSTSDIMNASMSSSMTTSQSNFAFAGVGGAGNNAAASAAQ